MPTPAGQSPVVTTTGPSDSDRHRQGRQRRSTWRPRRRPPPSRRAAGGRRAAASTAPGGPRDDEREREGGHRAAASSSSCACSRLCVDASLAVRPPPRRPRRARVIGTHRTTRSTSTSSSAVTARPMTIAVSAIAWLSGSLTGRARQRVDRRRAARQARGDERQDRGLRDDHDAEHDAHEVAAEQQVRAGAEQDGGGEREHEVHQSRPADEACEVVDEHGQDRP